jgi:hypothetical protein
MLHRSLATGPVIGRIVEVETVDDRASAALARDRRQRPVEFFLAIITTIGGIGRVVRVVEFVRLDDLVCGADRPRETDRTVALGRARLGEAAVTPIAAAPSSSVATASTSAESTPPENATTTLSERLQQRAQIAFLGDEGVGGDHGRRYSPRRSAISATGRSRSRAMRATSSYSSVRRACPSTSAVLTRTAPSGVSRVSTLRSSV